MGPNTDDEEMMRKLVKAGMDVARFNFSHGDHEEQKIRMDLLKKVRKELIQNMKHPQQVMHFYKKLNFKSVLKCGVKVVVYLI